MIKRVLSLDGGGVRCLLQAQILNDLYPGLSGRQILKQFDVITATSAGAVVLAGLIGDMSPYDIFQSFHQPDFLNSIFSRTWTPFFPKWSSQRKYDGLLKILPHSDQEMAVVSAQCQDIRILITAFDVQARKPFIFDSMNAPYVTLRQAVHASSTAPVTYFDKPASVNGRTYWDGGVSGLNNPAAYGTAVAKEMFPDDQIHTLSIGSGQIITAADFDMGRTAFYPNILRSCKDLISALVDNAPDVSSRYLWTMTEGSYIRLNPIIGPTQIGSYRRLPPVYYADKILGGDRGYQKLSRMKLDSKELSAIARLSAVGMYYLADKIPTQTIPQMSDLNSTNTSSMYYSRLKDKWAKLSEAQ